MSVNHICPNSSRTGVEFATRILSLMIVRCVHRRQYLDALREQLLERKDLDQAGPHFNLAMVTIQQLDTLVASVERLCLSRLAELGVLACKTFAPGEHWHRNRHNKRIISDAVCLSALRGWRKNQVPIDDLFADVHETISRVFAHVSGERGSNARPN